MKRYKVIDTDCEADVWFDNVENKLLDYKDIEKILEKQCSQWQKLKEWLEKVNHPKIVDEFTSGIDCAIKRVSDKMRELEGENEKN